MASSLKYFKDVELSSRIFYRNHQKRGMGEEDTKYISTAI